MKLKMYLIPFSLILVCIIFAAITRFSYTDAGDAVYNYEYNANDVMSDLLKENKISSPADIIDQADIIVKAKYNGKRKIIPDAFFSEVSVSQIYKGNKALLNEELCIIEPLEVFTKKQYINARGHFTIPLQKGDEYVLLLNHKEFDKSRKLNDFEKSQYYPVTQGAFGCYRISRKRQTECLDKSKKYTINDLLGMDIYATDSQVLDNYYDYKEQIFKSIGVYMND